MRFSDGVGRNVLAMKDATSLGTVSRFLMDAAGGRVAALQLSGSSERNLIDWDNVTGFGPDAVMVSGADQLRGPGNPWEERWQRGEITLGGTLVLTVEGEARGRLSDVEFDESSGRVQALITEEGVVPVDRLVAVGPYAVIIPA